MELKYIKWCSVQIVYAKIQNEIKAINNLEYYHELDIFAFPHLLTPILLVLIVPGSVRV